MSKTQSPTAPEPSTAPASSLVANIFPSTAAFSAFRAVARFHQVACIGLLLGLTSCSPSEQKLAELAELKRVECLEKICQGDVEPKRDYTKEVALKLNGTWFIGPKYYFSTGMNGAAFYWPSRKNREEVPSEEMRVPQENTIEIFLTGRQRWPNPKILAPWKNSSWERRFDELQKEGFRIERQQLRPDLERVRFYDAQGKPYRLEYFLATQQKLPLSRNSLPGIACEPYPDVSPGAKPGCTGSIFWQEDVYADFRLHAKHANDWPEIYQEITRVLSLLKKA